MDVQAAQHVALADHLQIVHHHVIAVGLRLPRAPPYCRRVGAGGKDREAVVGRNRPDHLAQVTELGPRLVHVGMGNRHRLDLRLQELAGDLAGGRPLGDLQEVLGHGAGDTLGLGVDQKVFFLNAEFVVVGHGPPLSC